jgi:hypothetical protein
MAVLSVFNQSNLTDHYRILREKIHEGITEVGPGPKDYAFRRFTCYLILDHIEMLRLKKAYTLVLSLNPYDEGTYYSTSNAI